MQAHNLAGLYDLAVLDWTAVTDRLDRGFTQAPGTGGPNRHSSWLTTLDADGAPHTTGIGSAWLDGTFWFETGQGTRKGRNLARDPRCTLALAVDEFDLVVSFNALHWVPEQELALASIRASLAPTGELLGRFVSRGDRTAIEDVIEEIRQRPRWAGYFRDFRKPYAHFRPEDYRDLATGAGLEVVRLHVNDKAWDFETRAAFTAFANATFVEWTRFLPEAESPAFVADVLDRYPSAAGRQGTGKYRNQQGQRCNSSHGIYPERCAIVSSHRAPGKSFDRSIFTWRETLE